MDKTAAAPKFTPDMWDVLDEAVGPNRDVEKMRQLARRFVDNAPIVGSDKEAAAEIINEYARLIRLARAALAKVQQ